MRPSKRLAAALAIAFGGLTVAASIAEAQQRRPLRVIVQKRSVFDPGNVVPVGTLNRYASQHFHTSPVYSHVGDRFGEGVLPGRIGSGPNPFANIF